MGDRDDPPLVWRGNGELLSVRGIRSGAVTQSLDGSNDFTRQALDGIKFGLELPVHRPQESPLVQDAVQA